MTTPLDASWVDPVVAELWKDEFEVKCALGGRLNEGKQAMGITPRWLATILEPKLISLVSDKDKARLILEDVSRRIHFKCSCNSKKNCLCNEGKTQTECMQNLTEAIRTGLRLYNEKKHL